MSRLLFVLATLAILTPSTLNLQAQCFRSVCRGVPVIKKVAVVKRVVVVEKIVPIVTPVTVFAPFAVQVPTYSTGYAPPVPALAAPGYGPPPPVAAPPPRIAPAPAAGPCDMTAVMTALNALTVRLTLIEKQLGGGTPPPRKAEGKEDNGGEKKLPPPGPKQTALQVFVAKCASCHDEKNAATKGGPNSFMLLKDGKVAPLTDREIRSIVKLTKNGKMPKSAGPELTPLTDDEFSVIDEWADTAKGIPEKSKKKDTDEEIKKKHYVSKVVRRPIRRRIP